MREDYKQAYFDKRELWEASAWKERSGDIERARIAAGWMPGEAHTILDIGCGNGVYTNLPDPERFKVGLDRSHVALEFLAAPALQADASAIPFENGSFDACISMEMLEHLPEDIYKRVIAEVLRVARKYVLISVPYKEQVQYNRVVCPRCNTKFHPYGHLREFQQADIQSLFTPQFTLVKSTAIGPRKAEVFPGLLDMYRRYRHRRGRNFPRTAVCPNCGYSQDDGQALPENSSGVPLKQTGISRWWPKRSSYTWWLALYQKNV